MTSTDDADIATAVVDTSRPKILFVVNEADFFISHRLRLALEATAAGASTVVVCARGTGERWLAELGIECRTVTMSRSGLNPLAELRTLFQLARIYRQEKPDLVHHVTVKPVIYGSLLARLLGVAAVVNAIPGLGYLFTHEDRWSGLRRALASRLYRLALAHPNCRIIVQNREDLEVLRTQVGVRRSDVYLIRGSGVDLDEFSHEPEHEGPPVFVLIARMLKDKGVREFVEAAAIVKAQLPACRFLLVGGIDQGNPSSLDQVELDQWCRRGIVEWLGRRTDVAAILRTSHVACLPTYREGLPKALIEAAAIGRAMIATDVAGCADVVRDGVTGLLVPLRDVTALADAMLRLGRDPVLRRRLGEAARKRAEILFSVDDVVHDTFLIYQELLAMRPEADVNGE